MLPFHVPTQGLLPLTVMVVNAVAWDTGSVTVIVAVPAATPVTIPEDAVLGETGLTVAKDASDVCHVTGIGLPDPSVTESVTALPTATVGEDGAI